jgi:hypothetical protein
MRIEERAHEVGEEKEGPRKDWSAKRLSRQLSYARKYDTEVVLNHTERQLVRESDEKMEGGPHGDRRRRREGIQGVKSEGRGCMKK